MRIQRHASHLNDWSRTEAQQTTCKDEQQEVSLQIGFRVQVPRSGAKPKMVQDALMPIPPLSSFHFDHQRRIELQSDAGRADSHHDEMPSAKTQPRNPRARCFRFNLLPSERSCSATQLQPDNTNYHRLHALFCHDLHMT